MGDDGDMRPTFAKGNRTTISRLLELRREALKDKEPRLVLRIQGILMSLEGHTTGEISHQLRVHRSTVPLWIDHWNRYGQKGLWEGHRSGRPRGLSPEEREKLCDILDSGPAAYGLETGIWTSPLVRLIIEEEFGQQYHPGHVRKLLRQLGYSVQRPTTRLVQADIKQQRKWVRYTYPNLKKTLKAKAR
jgi:transposase